MGSVLCSVLFTLHTLHKQIFAGNIVSQCMYMHMTKQNYFSLQPMREGVGDLCINRIQNYITDMLLLDAT